MSPRAGHIPERSVGQHQPRPASGYVKTAPGIPILHVAHSISGHFAGCYLLVCLLDVCIVGVNAAFAVMIALMLRFGSLMSAAPLSAKSVCQSCAPCMAVLLRDAVLGQSVPGVNNLNGVALVKSVFLAMLWLQCGLASCLLCIL